MAFDEAIAETNSGPIAALVANNADEDSIIIEAEDMTRQGFEVVSGDHASEGELVRLKDPRKHGDLETDFDGPAGCYDVTLFIQDESDGQSDIKVKVNGSVVGTIKLDLDTDGGGGNDGGFSQFTLSNIDLKDGDRITIWVDGDDHGYEYVRFDKLVLKPCEPPFKLCDDPNAVLLDFETDAFGHTVVAGDTAFDQFEGVSITAERADGGSPNDAMIFDSENPTGGDWDLETASQGNLLIISEDGNSGDPDDNAKGGIIRIQFDAPAMIHDLKFVDTEEPGGTVEVFDKDGQSIAVFGIPQTPDGGIAQLLVDTADVSLMVVSLAGSGAIDDICYIPGDLNSPPVAVDDVTIGFQDQPVFAFDVLQNDSDPDGDTLEVIQALMDDPSQGTITVNPDQTISFTPERLTTGPVVITYEITDGNGGTDTADFTINVIPNAAPIILEPISFEVEENKFLAGRMQAFDFENDPLTWSIIGGPDGALFNIGATTGVLSFLSPPDFENPDDSNGNNRYLLRVTVEDEFGSDEQLVLVTVLNVPDPRNAPAVAVDDFTIGFQGNPVTFDVLQNDSDPDGDTLEVKEATLVDPTAGSVTVNADQTLTFTPNVLTTGVVTINYEVTDGNGGNDTASLTINVIPNFRPLIREPISFRVEENQIVGGQLQAIDLEGDALTWSIVGGSDRALFEIEADTGLLTFRDAPDFEAPLDRNGDNQYVVKVRAADAFDFDEKNALVTVLDVDGLLA